MNILILSPNQINKYNWGHHLFRIEIARQHNVVFYGDGFENYNLKLEPFLKKINKNFKDFDFVLTYGLKYTRDLNYIYNLPDDLSKVHYVIDFFEPKNSFKGRDTEQYDFLNKYNPDIVFSVYRNSIKKLKKNINCSYIYQLPFSACTRTYINKKLNKLNKIMTCFSTRKDVYPNRLKVIKILNKNNLKYIQRKNRYSYVDAINYCKINLGVCDIYKSLNMRITEILACGGFLLTDKPNYIEEDLGLKNNIHYIEYHDFDDMIDKCKFYMKEKNSLKRNKIEITGMNYVRKYHSCQQRVKDMINIIQRII